VRVSARRVRILLCAAFSLVAMGCIPLPPGAYRPEQFPPGQGPDLARATVFQGLGAWWDVWDWSPTFTGGKQKFALGDVDRLAAAGVQTLYIQTATWRHPDDVLDEGLLRQIIARSRAKGMKVVGWYLPEHVDADLDLRRMRRAIELGVDGFGIDLESRRNPDEAARNAVLLHEVRTLRAWFPQLALAAIPVAPIVWEQLNATWWPNFPYRELAPHFDVWMPQNYWTYRKPESGLRDAYRYNVENIVLLRDLTGVPWLPVHPIGGEANGVTNDDLAQMYRAIVDTHSIGGSIYDDSITSSGLWGRLRWFRIPK
jgi:hypothetical protein